MDAQGFQRFNIHLRQFQTVPLSALAGDASSLAAAQQDLGDTMHAFTIENLEQQQHHQHAHYPLQNAGPTDTPVFLRPPRPGEPANNLLIAPHHHHHHYHHHHQTRQCQTIPSIQRQQRLPSNSGFEIKDTHNAEVNEPLGLVDCADHPRLRNSSIHSRTQPRPDMRNAHLDMLQSTEHSLQQPQPEPNLPFAADIPDKQEDYRKGMKLVPDPPDLELWREKLFNVDGMVILSEDQFQTYFPHVDNVYSHRSTQRYKRKPFVSHYWDCRLKGRPPGTPKSNDPNKKKRKRNSRQRDLCDVKIKVTEYFPGFAPETIPNEPDTSVPSDFIPGVNALFDQPDGQGPSGEESQPFGVLTPNPALPDDHPGADGGRLFTIQRVNGNGANGKNDGIGGGHRHTLEESDRVKKNSVQRHLANYARDKKKPNSVKTMAPQHQTSQKTYHTKATGTAALTALNHKDESDLKLFGSCFCPFVQRVWIALELKGIPYQYIEVDPYQKPQSLLEVNPRGLVPALRHGDWGCYESTVLMEYLEDLNTGTSLLPHDDAKLRAYSRLWADHVNRHIVPNFYRVLQEQEQEKHIEKAQELRDGFDKLITAAHPQGPFFLGPNISFVDIQVAPWVLRLRRVLQPYRGWPEPEAGSRWATWVNAIEADEHVRATTSTDELYLDSYERYAQNRPNTSQVANAINSGRGLP